MNSAKVNCLWLRYWVVLSCLVMFAPQAMAIDITNPVAPQELVPNPIQESVTPYKSPTTALGLSLGFTMGMTILGCVMRVSDDLAESGASTIIMGLGLTFGPSIGHFYTGDIGRATLTFLGRGVALVSVVHGITMRSSHDKSYDPGIGKALIIGGGLALLGLTVWDIIDAPFSAKRFNEKAAQQRSLAVTPLIIPPQDLSKSSANFYGLSLSGTF